MRQTSRILTVMLILTLSITALAVASERDSYAERSREWVDVEELERLIEVQMESIGPWVEYEMSPLIEDELLLMVEELAPMMEDLQIEIHESVLENMVDVHEIVRESLEAIDFAPRVYMDHYDSREDRLREEIELLEERLERMQERLQKLDEGL